MAMSLSVSVETISMNTKKTNVIKVMALALVISCKPDVMYWLLHMMYPTEKCTTVDHVHYTQKECPQCYNIIMLLNQKTFILYV